MQVKITDNSAIFKHAKDEAVLRALEAIGLTAERHAKEKCPVDTGRLRNSITHAVSGGPAAISEYKASYGSNKHKLKDKKTGEVKTVRYSAKNKNAGTVGGGTYSGTAPDDPDGKKAAYIGTNVEYAKYIEEGSSKNRKAHHFLRDAAQNHGDEYKRIVENILKNA